MNRTRFWLVSLFSVAALAVVAQPAAAQASVTAELINGLNERLLYIAIPITILVEGILLYTVLRFKKNDEPSPTKENRKLEITWTVATAVVLLFVGVASYGVLANENVTFQGGEEDIAPQENDVLVHVEAYQWGWRMSYPQENVQLSSAAPTVVIPEGQDVYFRITSTDVLHAFAVPEMGLKQDAIPGQNNTLKTVATEQGVYQGYCTEFCGVAHSNMYFEIEVVSQSEYQDFIESRQSSDDGSSNSSASDLEAADAAAA
jgi:cytochrome c oxidase subunit 2